MDDVQKNAIETYQCPGCALGSDTSCYIQGFALECRNHCPGIYVVGTGKIFLGMPKGFNRLGPNEYTKIIIYSKLSDYRGYTKFNVPVWKHLDKNGNTLVRVYSPRVNETLIHVFLENCLDKIQCIEITDEDIARMY